MDKAIAGIKSALKDLEQPSMFDLDYTGLEDACKLFLSKREYRIGKLPKKTNLKKTDDLVEAYYALERYWHNDKPGSYRNLMKDRTTAKRFVEARMEASGVDKVAALNECALIVRTVFRFEKEFNFTMAFSFGMFGQKKCGWITERALSIFQDAKLNSDYDEIMAEEIADKYFAEHINEITGIINENREGVL